MLTSAGCCCCCWWLLLLLLQGHFQAALANL